jgi:adenine-specific DNA-methyltransferase
MVNNKSIQPIVNELPSHFADRLGVYYASLVKQEHKKRKDNFSHHGILLCGWELLQIPKSSLRILDPGCGTVILTCALLEHLELIRISNQ